MSTGTPPVIIIGMHRSGTTMVARLLQDLGLHLGWLQQENSEALFFVERNDRLIGACGGSWEHPEPVENLLRHPRMRALAAARLRRDLGSLRFLSYLGPAHWRRCGGPQRLDFPWGWKDPRNTFLLPLWLDVFPQARVVHIYRHPMDVALSLFVREQRNVAERIGRLSGARPDPPEAGRARAGASRERGLLYVYRRVAAARAKLTPLHPYERYGVGDVTAMENGFRLWRLHVGKCFEHLSRIPNASVHVKYEDFLAGPETLLASLAEFCGLAATPQALRDVCRAVRADRRYAFQSHDVARGLSERFRGDEWVRKLGYDRI